MSTGRIICASHMGSITNELEYHRTCFSAKQYLANKEYEQANEQLALALKYNASDYQVYYLFAKCLFMQFNDLENKKKITKLCYLENGIGHLDISLKHKQNHAIYKLRAEMQFELYDLTNNTTLLSKIVADTGNALLYNKKDDFCYYLSGIANFKLRNIDAARSDIECAQLINPNSSKYRAAYNLILTNQSPSIQLFDQLTNNSNRAGM